MSSGIGNLSSAELGIILQFPKYLNADDLSDISFDTLQETYVQIDLSEYSLEK